MKIHNGHSYETVEDWHPVVIQAPTGFYDKIVHLPAWLSEHCPNCDEDYDAWVYGGDDGMNPVHRTIYFFRDEATAILFALRWS
jgi:hypothetical protein